MQHLKNNKKIYILLIPVIILLLLCLYFVVFGIHDTDSNMLEYISKFRNDKLTPVMESMSNLCTPISMLVISFIIFILVKDKRVGVLQIINFGVAGVLSYALKYIFMRERPLEYMIAAETSYSFPSAHTMISVAFYGYIIYLISKSIDKKYIRVMSIIGVSVILLLIIFSRLYLGVHYPTDVIAGTIFGYIYLLLFIKLSNRYIFDKTRVKQESI